MIRVLHSVSNMDRGGVETMLMNYYRHIDRTQVQFDFLCNKKKPGHYDEEIRSMGGRIFRTPGLNPVRYPLYLTYMRALFQKYPEYKIVEAHNGPFGVYALYAAKKNGVPHRIFHAHGASLIKDKKYLLKLFCKCRIEAVSNHYFTCGVEASKFYFSEQINQEQSYVLIPNAINLSAFRFQPTLRNKLRVQYNLSDQKVIGHIGRFMSQKNHTFLIDIFHALYQTDTSYHLVLLGEGELMGHIQAKVTALGIQDAVTFVGNVANANEWYQAFDLFLLPSLFEGLPVVGIEAAAAGLPCVYSKTITREVQLSPRTVFVGLDEPVSTWVQKIQSMIESPDLELCDDGYELMRGKGYELIRNQGYDIQNEAKKLEDIYTTMRS